MSYRGLVAEIPLGQGGLQTDQAPSLIPVTSAYRATNVMLQSGVLSNSQGTRRWNQGSKTLTVTFSSITNLVTAANHGLINGTPITFATTGSLASPLQSGAVTYSGGFTTSNVYYAVSVSTNTFKVSSNCSTSGIITLTTNGTGTNTCTASIPVPLLAKSQAVTFSSSVATSAAHGMRDGQSIYFTTTGALPASLVIGTNYVAVNCSVNTFQVSTDGINALSLTGSGTGTHTLNVIDGVVQFVDYFPVPGIQYQIVVTRSGRVYRFSNPYQYVEITPTGTAPARLSVQERVHILECGQEQAGNNKKLFIFTGGSPVQVISGSAVTRSNIASPPTDWASNYPTFGIVYLNRVFAFGNSNLPHFAYASSSTNHEDFTAAFNSALFNIYPGDGQKLVSAFNYKGRLHIAKYPRGLYGITIQDIGTVTTWYFTKLNEDMGTTSIHGTTPVFDDVWMSSAEGGVYSLSAAFKLGNLDTANVLREMKVVDYIKQVTSPLGVGERQALWHATKKRALFLFRKQGSANNSFTSSSHPSVLLSFDLTEQNPSLTIEDKDQLNCMSLVKGIDYNDQLFYGSEDGFIYQAEQENRWQDPFVQSSSQFVAEYQTPHMDFTQNDLQAQTVRKTDKNYDFLEIEYIPTSATNISASIYIDGIFSETKSFYLGKGPQLGVFQLGTSRLQGQSVRTQRLQIHGRGRTISVKFNYTAVNSGSNFGYPIKLTKAKIYYRIQGQNEKT